MMKDLIFAPCRCLTCKPVTDPSFLLSWGGLLILFLLLSACTGVGVQKPYGTLGSPVKPIGSGNNVYFNGQFEKAHPSGEHIFYFDYDELGTLTDSDKVSEYFLSHRLMPPYCLKGIRIVRGGRGENGKAWLIFVCGE